jgi:Ca-activated chloride channel family protein
MTAFLDPQYLLLLLLIPVVYLLHRYVTGRKKAQAMEFSHVAFLRSAMGEVKVSRRPRYLFLLSLFALALMVVGFANPMVPLEQTKEGVNVVLVMDISGSMQATDYPPNRLDAAKRSAGVLLRSLDPLDLAGVVTFESGATTAAYLSPDKGRVIEKLNAIAPKEGQTALGDGLLLGIDMASSIPNRQKVVILLSDGVANAGVVSPDEATAYAKENKIQVYTIGLGSESPVVLGYDWFGNAVNAELDEATLSKVASETGGKYFKSVDDRTLREIYAGLNREIVREKEETPIGWVFFLCAFFVLLAEIYFRYGRGRIIP